jgi:hypothetical protein
VDRQLPAVVGVLVLAGERLRQPGQPLAGEPVDLLAGQPVADPLDRLGVADRAERVVQRGERDPFFQALPLGVLVPVEVLRCRRDYAEPVGMADSGFVQVVLVLPVSSA